MAIQAAQVARNPRRQQQAIIRPVPAPVGGLNDRDSVASMSPEDAVISNNWWGYPSKVALRKGSITWVTGLGAQVETLMGYRPQSGTAALFGAAGTSFYNVTATGAVGAAVVTGLTNARWQFVNSSTSAGSFLMAVNGSDKLRGWDGATWWTDGDGAHDITGVDTATCIWIGVFKRRIWLIQKNTGKIWYLPTDAIAGVAVALDFGPIFQRGGYLNAMGNWTIDGGIGVDDYAAFISSEGEVAVFKGTDPASSTTWALQGLYWIGAPVGRRCLVQYAGDVAIISQDGLIPLSKALTTQRLNSQIAFSDKIMNKISMLVTAYSANFGWQVLPFSGENMLLLNVPVAVGGQMQYVMNTINGSWWPFSGWPANCWELFGNEIYFGGNGNVYKAWQGTSDSNADIAFEILQAFNYFGNPEMFKQFTMARPLLALANNAAFSFGINTDFDTTAPLGTPTYTPTSAGKWDSGLWDMALWGGDPAIQKNWQTVSGTGYCGALHIRGQTSVGSIEWSGTDFAFKEGGVL